MKTLIFLFSCIFFNSFAQQKKQFTKIFQASLAPGISTNGLHPGGYTNYFSVNLTAGYSAANYILEIGIISNLNELETRGLQLASLANLTGSNAFASLYPKEIEKKKKEGFEANLSGAQFSGVANIVLNNVFGWQTTGGVNIAKGALQGAQFAGISNTVNKYSFGLQMAGIYNVSAESMDGFQISGLLNITHGGLYGAQIGAFNRARLMEGVNSFNSDDPTAFQIGVVNYTSIMNGYQIGLVNIGRRMQGTQIGLINIFRNGKTPETRDGTSIGLLNIGSSGYFSVYANELFFTNVEIATGTVKNRRINSDEYQKQIQNGLIYSKDLGFLSDRERWAIGYGVKKFYFKQSLVPGMNRFRYFSFGIDLLHISHEKNFTKELSLLTRPHFGVGSKLHPKNKICYFFASVAYSIYRSASGRSIETIFSKQTTEQVSGIQSWPGFAAGMLIQ